MSLLTILIITEIEGSLQLLGDVLRLLLPLLPTSPLLPTTSLLSFFCLLSLADQHTSAAALCGASESLPLLDQCLVSLLSPLYNCSFSLV